MKSDEQLATFAGGCFWSVELAFQVGGLRGWRRGGVCSCSDRVGRPKPAPLTAMPATPPRLPPEVQRTPGVVSTAVGYAQGITENPTYEQVSCRRRCRFVCCIPQLLPRCFLCGAARPATIIIAALPDTLLLPGHHHTLAHRLTSPRLPPQVCSGRTGHTEAVQLTYRPAEVSFDDLTTVFLKKIDPRQVGAVSLRVAQFLTQQAAAQADTKPGTGQPHPLAVLPTRRPVPALLSLPQKNGQGGDIGSQYRTGIYWHTPEQQQVAQARLAAIPGCAVEAEPVKTFWPAETYHQQYLEKGGRNGRAQSAAKMCNDPIRCYG